VTYLPCSLIERHPIIIKEPEPWERDFEAVQETLMQYGRVRQLCHDDIA
jgi:enolase